MDSSTLAWSYGPVDYNLHPGSSFHCVYLGKKKLGFLLSCVCLCLKTSKVWQAEDGMTPTFVQTAENIIPHWMVARINPFCVRLYHML